MAEFLMASSLLAMVSAALATIADGLGANVQAFWVIWWLYAVLVLSAEVFERMTK